MNARRYATARNGLAACALALLSLTVFVPTTGEAAFLVALAALVLSLNSL